jgi:hypothetical protein
MGTGVYTPAGYEDPNTRLMPSDASLDSRSFTEFPSFVTSEYFTPALFGPVTGFDAADGVSGWWKMTRDISRGLDPSLSRLRLRCSRRGDPRIKSADDVFGVKETESTRHPRA